MAIGPKDIYNYTGKTQVIDPFCKDDNPESVEKFKTFYQIAHEGEFLNGRYTGYNILMWAAGEANVSLLKYIAENANHSILDMRNRLGETALHVLVKRCSAPLEKVIACAQILIQAGANIHTRCNYKYGFDQSHLPKPEIALDEENFEGDDVLGFLARELSDTLPITHKEKESYEALTQLFLFYGVTHGYDATTDKFWQTTGRFSIDDPVNEEDTSVRTVLVRVLRSAQEKNLDWPKSRLLCLGSKDPGSSLAEVPADLQKLILQRISQLTFENRA